MSLDLDEYLRYGRQMIVPEFGGLSTQTDLQKSSILIIGAGGLGCPAIAYLAGAGVGSLTIVDGDTVEASNLHRQVVHSTATVGEYKAVSAAKFVANLNPHVKVRTVTSNLTLDNVFNVIRTKETAAAESGPWDFDVILDCSDNPATRYLVNDAAVLANTPLVSASALKTEGQLCLLNFQRGPCYRCFFPVPPPANSVVACGDGGILGPVVGMMGVYQALEAIKIVAKIYEGPEPKQQYTPALMLFSALSFPPWRSMRMRGAKPGCAACDPTSPVTRKDIEARDYAAFCGHVEGPRISPEERISAGNYSQVVKSGKKHVLIDVRPRAHFGICSLPNSINIPLDELQTMDGTKIKDLTQWGDDPIYVVCRYGNDSQPGVTTIKDKLGATEVWDIIGGLNAWSAQVDADFPRY